MSQTKPIEISKYEVEEAYKRVKANKGSAGIDHQSLQDFDRDKSNHLYKLWNRLSSGSYMSPPVLRVGIPKGDGEMRALGVPTITDRIGQMVVKQRIEPELEQHFHPDSYGYRPNKSALEAVALTRTRCWKRAWVLDMDIKGFFDDINHDRLMRAVNQHVPEK
jgi:group II intron reverse transcriptase/maturase